jgi:hypothetical protein
MLVFFVTFAIFFCGAIFLIPEKAKTGSAILLAFGIMTIVGSATDKWDKVCLLLGIVLTLAGSISIAIAFNLF